ncbi:MAG: efflux RND transporter periplasmic adaptor subunit, partial [Acidimicrobiales bacterium]
SVPEQHLSEIRARKSEGTLEVRAAIPERADTPLSGELTFLDNAVDRSTGTVRLKATFPNRDRVLWPGQFVEVHLRVSTHPGAIVVPSQALQTGQQGPFVFVVKADQTVDSRPVVAGGATGGDTVIEKGLEAGETVVTDGQLRLVPGSHVAVSGGGARP